MGPSKRALKEYRIASLENAIWGAIQKTYSETWHIEVDDQEAAQALSMCLARALGIPIEDDND